MIVTYKNLRGETAVAVGTAMTANVKLESVKEGKGAGKGALPGNLLRGKRPGN